MTGFDASGHIAEETKNARYVFALLGRCFPESSFLSELLLEKVSCLAQLRRVFWVL